MLIEAGFDVAFECPATTPMILQLSIHPSRDADQRPDRVETRFNTARHEQARLSLSQGLRRIILGLPASRATERLKSDRPNPA
jgi:hypothetical protein